MLVDIPDVGAILSVFASFIGGLAAVTIYNKVKPRLVSESENAKILSARRHDFEGYIPLNEVLNPEILKLKPQYVSQSTMKNESSLDTNMVNALENIISICKEKNIALYIINSPVYHTVNEIQSPAYAVTKISLDIIHRNHVNFLDFSDDPAFVGHPELFADNGHLNDKGAKVFSNMVVNSLSKSKIIFQKFKLLQVKSLG